MDTVLLVQPPIRDFYLTAKRTMPYGLACVASPLLADGFRVEILDGLATSRSRRRAWPDEFGHLDAFFGRSDRSSFSLFHDFRHFGYSYQHLAREARASGAFLVGISSLFTAYADQALRVAEEIKGQHPGCRVVLGGHHPTTLPGRVMASPHVDFVIRGDGEEALLLLARALRSGDPRRLDEVPGLVRRTAAGGLRIVEPTYLSRLDAAPLPASRLMNRAFYKERGKRRAVIVAGRGCPMRCSYCSVGAGSGIPYRRRAVQSVLDEISREVEDREVGLIDFEDENLGLGRRWFLALLDGLGSILPGGVELRAMNGLMPHTLDEEVIVAMKSAGFTTLNLSLGSSDPEQLRRFNRRDERLAFDRALDLAEAHDMQAVGYVIAGAPGQLPDRSVQDLIWLARRRVLAGISIYYPSPGSEDFDRSEAAGVLPLAQSMLRSTALPIDGTTSRVDAVTIWRLGRILNFIKSLVDTGEGIPEPAPLNPEDLVDEDRRQQSILLLRSFLHDAVIRGITREGEVFDHCCSSRLCRLFIDEIEHGTIRGITA